VVFFAFPLEEMSTTPPPSDPSVTDPGPDAGDPAQVAVVNRIESFFNPAP